MTLISGTPQTMARVNRSAIQRAIEEWGPISRADLARRLSLSGATVTRVVAGLLAGGVVVEDRQGVSTGGRRPILLKVAPRASTVIAVDVGGTKIATGIVDRTGGILYEHVAPTRQGDTTPLTVLLRELQAAQSDAARHGITLGGIGIGAPGIAHQQSGTVEYAPAVGWHGFPLRRAVEEATGLRTFIENDGNLAALGEYAYGAGQGERCLVVIVVGTAVGSGMVIEGRLHRGAHEAAGEVGYFLSNRAALDCQYPGFGALEGEVAGPGIVRRARARLIAGEASTLGALPPDAVTARAIFDAAEHGDTLATVVVAETADLLALLIGGFATILNPGTIVIGGGIGRRAAALIPRIRERLMGRVPFVPALAGSVLHERAVLYGAAALADRSLAGGIHVTESQP